MVPETPDRYSRRRLSYSTLHITNEAGCRRSLGRSAFRKLDMKTFIQMPPRTDPMNNKPTNVHDFSQTDITSMSGIEFIQGLFDGKIPAPPIVEFMGAERSTVEPGLVVTHCTPTSLHYNGFGVVHGGYAATMLDTVMGLAVLSQLPAGTGYTSLEIKVSFIRGMNKDTGAIRCEGKILNVGRRAATAEGRITDSKGRLLAHATTTCLIFEIPSGTSSAG
jgi:uncharacterized protein (TIGR00369 family)